MQVIPNSPIKDEPNGVSLKYIILDHPWRCLYSSIKYQFTIPRCESYQLGSIVDIIGTEEVVSDGDVYQKKRLTVQSIDAFFIELSSVNTWKIRVFEPIILLKSTLLKQVMGYIKPHQLGVVKSMLFADRGSLPATTSLKLKSIGMSHVLAASGLHLSVIVGIFKVILTPFKPKSSFLPLVVTAWSYALMAGLRASMTRAVLMLTISMFAAQVIKKKLHPLWTLLLTVTLLLIINPYYVADVGFQLSVVATFSILAGSYFWSDPSQRPSLIQKMLVGDISQVGVAAAATNTAAQIFSFSKIKAGFVDAFKVTVMVQLGLLPLQLYYFEEVSMIGFLANPLLLWLIPLLIISWLVTLMALFILSPFSFFLTLKPLLLTVPRSILVFFLSMVGVFNQFDYLVIKITAFPVYLGLLWIAFLAVVSVCYKKIQKKSSKVNGYRLLK